MVQLLLFTFVLALRVILSALLTPAAVPALLTAMLSSGAMAAWRSAQWSLEIESQKLMDTQLASDPKTLLAAALAKAGHLNVRFLRLSLSIEDCLCLAISFMQLALLFFFENWGLHGPRGFRWAAVAMHAMAALVVLISARLTLLPEASASDGGGARGGSALWLSLTLGHWATISWATATWWHAAALSAVEAAVATSTAANAPAVGGMLEADTMDPALLHTTLFFHVPMAASVIMHLANIWNASRAREPLLLFTCVVLAGVSVAASCCLYCGTPGDGWLGAHWRASVLPLFFLMAAWVLWQELVRSLSAD